MENRTTFIFNTGWADDIEELDSETRLKFFDAIVAYARYGEMPNNMSNMEMAVFKGMRRDIDAMQERFDDIKEKRAEAGRKSAEARRTKGTKRTNVDFVEQNEQTSTKRTNVDFVEQNEHNEYENEYEYENVCDEITPHTRTHDTSIIDKEISSLKKQAGWLDEEQVLHHVPKDNLIRWLDQFAVQLKADGHPGHANQRDLKSHFNRWLAPKLKEQQTTPSQHDRRSRTNISPGEVKDYNSSF